MTEWPQDNETALIAFYGDPSRSVEAQLVHVVPPFRMTYEGKPVPHLVFHKKAADALLAALTTVWDYYGHDQAKLDALGISKTAGTFNPRKIAGSNRWSNHAFGAAIDINADDNGFNKGHGNIPVPMIAAFKAQGARWGGDYRGRTDPMHFEFCASGEPQQSFEAWLAHYGVGGPAAQPAPQPQPQPSRAGRMTGITATVFGGSRDPNRSAYDGHLIGDSELGVALPAHIAGTLPTVRVINGDKAVICKVVDIGPWNTDDPYWVTGARPQSESGTDRRGRRTNHAGIDLTPAAANALGVDGKGTVDWEFVS